MTKLRYNQHSIPTSPEVTGARYGALHTHVHTAILWRGDGVWTRSRNLAGMVIGQYVTRRKGGKRTANGVDR